MSKKQLKTPDELWQAFKKIMTWISKHGLKFGISVTVFLALIIGWAYSTQLKRQEEGKAQYHLSLAKTEFEQYKLEKDEKEKEESLKELSAELEALATKYPHSVANHLAMLIRADLAQEKEKWDEAAQYYRDYVEFLPYEDKMLGLFPLAKCYEQGQKYEEALKAYEEIIQVGESAFEEVAYLGKARSLRLLNRAADAESVYNEFLEKFPDSTEVSSVRGLLALTREISKK